MRAFILMAAMVVAGTSGVQAENWLQQKWNSAVGFAKNQVNNLATQCKDIEAVFVLGGVELGKFRFGSTRDTSLGALKETYKNDMGQKDPALSEFARYAAQASSWSKDPNDHSCFILKSDLEKEIAESKMGGKTVKDEVKKLWEMFSNTLGTQANIDNDDTSKPMVPFVGFRVAEKDQDPAYKSNGAPGANKYFFSRIKPSLEEPKQMASQTVSTTSSK